MKKIIGFLSLIALITISACTDRKSAEVKKAVTNVPSSALAAPAKKATIVLDKNGAKVATKELEITVGSKK